MSLPRRSRRCQDGQDSEAGLADRWPLRTGRSGMAVREVPPDLARPVVLDDVLKDLGRDALITRLLVRPYEGMMHCGPTVIASWVTELSDDVPGQRAYKLVSRGRVGFMLRPELRPFVTSLDTLEDKCLLPQHRNLLCRIGMMAPAAELKPLKSSELDRLMRLIPFGSWVRMMPVQNPLGVGL